MLDHHEVTVTTADRLRTLLFQANLSQREAARRLGIEERTMRQWCSGHGTPPASIFRALDPRLTHLEVMQQTIDSNESIIASIDIGMAFGVNGKTSPLYTQQSREYYVQKNEELRALLRVQAAFDRQQRAVYAVTSNSLSDGDGVVSTEICDEIDAAQAEFQAAKSECDRITQEIREGKRR